MKNLIIIPPNSHFGLYLSILIVLQLTACGSGQNQEKSEVDTLYDQVIAIHDEVMPKMSEIVSLRKDAKDRLNTEMEKETPDSLTVALLQSQIKELDQADDAMMSWMRSFKANMEGMSEQEQIDYLIEEQKKISEVKEMMLGAIERAKKILQ